MSELVLSAQAARLVHLAAQGLLQRPAARPTAQSVLEAIRRMELLQIDTIHVVARSPYLTLYSRLGRYKSEWLEALLEQGALFECWAHEACFAPMEDYLLHRRRIDASRHWSMRHAQRMQREHGPGMAQLLEHVRLHGPVKTSDFERSEGQGGGWWGWKQEKRWLEAHFALGELMIARRDRFHRVYDVRERVLARARPEWIAAEPPPAAEVDRALILRSVRALGVTQARWIADYFRAAKKHKDQDLSPLVERGELLRLEVRGWDRPAYAHPEHLPLLERAAAGALRATHTTLLSPFDPVVWDRARASVMFDFDYRIECYTPAPKRRYGYFVLPILDRGSLVGRLDAKAHREDGVFEVKALYLEPGVEPDAARVRRLARALQACARWHRCPEVQVKKSAPRGLARALVQALPGSARGSTARPARRVT